MCELFAISNKVHLFISTSYLTLIRRLSEDYVDGNGKMMVGCVEVTLQTSYKNKLLIVSKPAANPITQHPADGNAIAEPCINSYMGA